MANIMQGKCIIGKNEGSSRDHMAPSTTKIEVLRVYLELLPKRGNCSGACCCRQRPRNDGGKDAEEREKVKERDEQ